MNQTPKYTWRPDIPDFRDLKYSVVQAPANPYPMPSSVDLRTLCSSVEDQGSLGACTGHALVGALD